MTILDKPSGRSEVYASPQEALQRRSGSMNIPISSFVSNLDHPGVQVMNSEAHAQCLRRRQGLAG